MLWQAVAQTWQPFVLVGGLLMVGGVAAADGLFEAIAAQFVRAPLSPTCLLFAALTLVAAVTAVLNLDTAVLFLTPVLVHLARRSGLDKRPFLYGTVLMANAGSLLLPGSNPANLIVLGGGHGLGLRMLPAWAAACAATAVGILVALRPTCVEPAESLRTAPSPGAIGAAATLGAAVLVVAVANPAVPVLLLGVGAMAARRLRPRLDVRLPGLLFVVAVALGTLARTWAGPGHLLVSGGRWATAAVGALASVLIDNLPASALLAAHAPRHPRALLVGLDVGPNLAVTGSLSAYLWWQAAKSVGARPSALAYSALGLALAPAAGVAALLALG
jgi:arsenical pump membrane protein